MRVPFFLSFFVKIKDRSFLNLFFSFGGRGGGGGEHVTLTGPLSPRGPNEYQVPVKCWLYLAENWPLFQS